MKTRAIFTVQIAALVLITALAHADVYLNCADLGNGVIELSYVNEEPIPIRAFALDIQVSHGIITSVANLNPEYYVYPGSIEIDPDGEIVCRSSPIASPSLPGTLGGLHTSGMTVEMGSLYIGEANAPPPTGVLFTFTITAECSITVEENAGHGGIVFEDGEHNGPVHSPGLAGALPPEPEEYGGGSGTAADPFLIFNAEQLNTVGISPADWQKQFKLMADIDLTDYGPTEFNIIGTGICAAFGGVFDGNNHRISNFTYTSNDADYVGLFGSVDGDDALIRDLDLVNPNLDAGSGDNVGPLVGYLNRGTISRCSSQSGTVQGNVAVGGLIGRNIEGTVTDCYSSTDVTGVLSLGGLVGKTYADVSNCYSTGSVCQYADSMGGFVGCNSGVISSAFYDQQTSGQTEGAGSTGGSAVTDVTPKPTAQMKTQTTFADAGWDFKGETQNGTDDIWTICEGITYPRLARQGYIGNFIGADSIDLQDFAVLAAAWKSTPAQSNWNPSCDISESPDNIIDEHDLAIFALSYLSGTE